MFILGLSQRFLRGHLAGLVLFTVLTRWRAYGAIIYFHFSLFTFHFSFFTFHFSFFTFRFPLFTFHFSLFTFHFSLFVFRFSFFTFYFLLLVFHLLRACPCFAGSPHYGLRFARCFARFAPPCGSRKNLLPEAKPHKPCQKNQLIHSLFYPSPS